MVGGAQASMPSFDDHTWTAAKVPSTVLANLVGAHVGDGTSRDPYRGENWLKLPGSGPYYPRGKNFGGIETPLESPFGHPWWYRTTFRLSKSDLASFIDLHFNGITYGAEIWLNGVQIATPSETRGTYRHFKFDVSRAVREGANSLAVLVFPPRPTDLTSSWVDWNPTPQDKNMGLWREVLLRLHGPVRLRHAFVTSDIHFPKMDQADLTIEAEVSNASSNPITGTLTASTQGIELSQPVSLAAGEAKIVSFTPAQFVGLKIANPKLWWPWQMGQATLHKVKLTFEIAGVVSDSTSKMYGIRKVESHLTPEGSRLFTINEKPVFIRGGGWSSDLLLRFSPERQRRELAYVKSLGLNTVRLEGRFETESFLSMTDRMGLLVMPGWVCCNAWQDNQAWLPEHFDIAKASLRDQLMEYRSHASSLAFLYGSDEVPTPEAEKLYLDTIAETKWPNPSLAAAAQRGSTVGPTGVKMTGPYSYTPPSYWYADKNRFGGAWGFNTETSPGISMPPLESLRKFIPTANFGTVDRIWTFHLGENEFADFNAHRDAITRRYGAIADVKDFVKKSEVMDYDNHRAMFEAYQRSKYHSATGLIQWMLNSAWPSMLWHLYDFYLNPNAAFYAVKKANSPVHVQFSYDDQSVVVVNSTYEPKDSLVVIAKIVDLRGNVLFQRQTPTSVAADSSKDIFNLSEPKLLNYFVWLELKDASGASIDHNFYWISTQKEVFNWADTDFKITPVLKEADLTALEKMSKTTITVKTDVASNNRSALVTLTNTGSRVAFFVHVDVDANGRELLPIEWSDNDISLLPGETRQLEVHVPFEKPKEALKIHGRGWNIASW